MGYTNSNPKDEDALFRTELIEKLMKFGNHYEESLALIIDNNEVQEILSKIAKEQEKHDKKPVDVLSIWKNMNQQH